MEEKKQSQTIARYMKQEEKQALTGNNNVSAKTTVLLNELRVWKEKVVKLECVNEVSVANSSHNRYNFNFLALLENFKMERDERVVFKPNR